MFSRLLLAFLSTPATGTVVTYHPGLLKGGRKLKHDCGTQRSIGYFLEFLVCLAPFCKRPVHITLTGITNKDEDPSVCRCPNMIHKSRH